MKREMLYYYVFLLFFWCVNIFGRVLFSPSVDSWFWYTATIEYPIEFYYYNRRSNFCWDVGVSYINRFASKGMIVDKISQGDNLSTLFHGADQFSLDEFEPLTVNIVSNQGEYVFLPDYVFNENACKINVQVSRDFEYGDDCYVRNTLRCILPFATQSVVNIASGNMYYNTSDSLRRKNEVVSTEKSILKKLPERRRDCSFLSSNEQVQTTDKAFSPSQVSAKQENGQTVFAIQASYVADALTDPTKKILIDIQTNQLNLPYMVLNKNAVSADFLSSGLLTLDGICNSWSLVTQSGQSNQFIYAPITGILDATTVTSNNTQNYTVSTVSPMQNTLQDQAFISVYSYPEQSAVDGFCVYGQYGIPYTVLTNPDYIVDLSVGDLVTTRDLVYGNGLTGSMLSGTGQTPNIIPNNSIIRLLATANFGSDNSDPAYPWNRTAVSFGVPPVIVQQGVSGSFPSVYGVAVNLPDHAYASTLGGQQFVSYSDYLNQIGEEEITLLNTDGSFANPAAPYAVLWYANDYTNLFTAQNESILNNLYITSSLDPVSKAPTQVSQLLADEISGDTPVPPDPTCCIVLQQEIDDLALYTQNSVYVPLAEAINSNSLYLNDQISQLWTLLNVNNNIVGNVSPIANKQTGASTVPTAPVNVFGVRGLNKNRSSYQLNQEMFKNGQWQSMQYNGFNATGLGDLTLEWLIGSYFYDKKFIFDFLLALECPTAQAIDESTSYLAVGLGNNGHYVGRFGVQGVVDFDYLFRFRMSSRIYYEHGFSGFEKLVPQLNGYQIFGMVPVKMDTNVSWNAGFFYIDGSLYANDYSGFTCSYQYWHKSTDCIRMLNEMAIAIPNINPENSTENAIIVPPDFSNVMYMSKRITHTLSLNFFSRLTNECFINGGFSRAFAGENAPLVMDFFVSVGLSY